MAVNARLIVAVLVFNGGTLIANSVQAQIAISNDGVTFPDETEQTSAVVVPMNCPHGDSIVWDTNAESWVCETDLSSLTEVPDNPGDLIITEIMPNPTVSDVLGEWFEIFNPTSTNFDLQGLVITDGEASFQISAPVEIQAGDYIVLGRNEDFGTNGGVPVDFEYMDITLSNIADEIEILNGAVSIDIVRYVNTVEGTAYELSVNHFDVTLNDDPNNWCQAVSAFGDGDFGTPGADNSCAL